MNVIVPVRYPLTETNLAALRRGLELAGDGEGSELLVFHLNELHRDGRVGRDELRAAVEDALGELPANYHVANGFVVEEAVLEAAVELGMEVVVISRERRERWGRLLETVLGIDDDLESVLRARADLRVEVVDPPDATG